MTVRRRLFPCFLLLLVGMVHAEQPPAPVETEVFTSGQGEYNTYRIPSVITTKQGTLLAFCEGRVKDRSDSGNIDLVLRRSKDNGKTWSDLAVVWNDERNTCGNPCPVIDQENGTIWLLMTWNDGSLPEKATKAGFGRDTRRVFVTHSQDDGQTWSDPKDITRDVKQEAWTWYATGPGNGIQLQQGEHKGRLVIPCDHKIKDSEGEKGYSHVIYSDDSGQSWQLGGATPEDGCNECEVAELADGRLLLNMRSYDKSVKFRQVSTSDDGGLTWSPPKSDETLIEPICQASFRRYRWPSEGKPGVLLFSNPASQKGRERLTVRASYDDGKSWPDAQVLHPRSSAYSCLTVLPDGSIGCLYEKDNYSRIVFARFSLDWLMAGQPE